MKHFTFLLFNLFAICLYGQDAIEINGVKYGRDTIYVENKKIAVGDTVQLGFGSGNNKQFLFLYLAPTALNASPTPQYLGHGYSNAFMVLKEIRFKKGFGITYATPIFYGYNHKMAKITGDLRNAVKTGEISF